MRKPTPGKSLAEKRPDLIPYWSVKNTVDPSDVYSSAGKPKRWWICPKGHEDYLMTCHDRSRGRACSECKKESISSKLSVAPYKKSLGYLFPDIAATWSEKNTKTPFEVYPYSHSKNLKYKWICEYCGEEYSMTCANRCNGNGCSPCGIKKAHRKQEIPTLGHSLSDVFPLVASTWSFNNNKIPTEVNPKATYMAKWVCTKCGQEWKAWVYNRVRTSGTLCPDCVNLGTSTAEQHLRTALIPFGASSDSQTKLGPWKVDIYIPSSKTVVEYDGSYYHSSDRSYERDKRKSLELLELGYRVIRVRTFSKGYSLESLQIESINYREIFTRELLDSQPTPDLLDKITSLL